MNRLNILLLFIALFLNNLWNNQSIAQDNHATYNNESNLIIIHSDSIEVKKMHDTIWYYIERDLSKAKELIDVYKSIITENKIDMYSVDLCNIKSAYFNYKGMNDSSIYYLEKSIDMIKAIDGDSSFIYGENQLPYLYNNIAIIYDDIGLYETAIEFQFMSMYEIEDILKADSTDIKMQILYANGSTELGMYHSNIGDSINAEKYFERGLKLANKYNDSDAIIYAEFNYGVYLADINRIDTAIKLFYKIDNYYKLRDNNYNQILTKLNISEAYGKQSKHKLAMAMIDSCIDLSQKYGFYSLYKTSKRMYFFHSLNFLDPNISISLGKEYLSIAEPINDKLGIQVVSFELAKIYQDKGELDKAYPYLLKTKLIGDSIINRDHQSNVSTLESKYKLKQTSIENKILIREGDVKDKYIKDQKRTTRIIIILLILVSSFGSVLLMSGRKMKRINNKLKNSNKLLEAKSTELNSYNLALERTFSVVSHDLKGPIGAADSFFKILNDNEIEITDSQRDNYIRIVGTSMSVTYNMLEELLIWSKHRINNTVDYSVFSLYQLVKSVIKNVDSTVFTKNIVIQNNIDSEIILNTDRKYLRIVIRNIITNAIKFTNDGGSISISMKNSQSGYTIDIKDNGVGMSEEVLKQLFTNNKSKEGTRNELGTGLGLMISRDIIKAIGGDIIVKSKIGEGSVFSVVLQESMLDSH